MLQSKFTDGNFEAVNCHSEMREWWRVYRIGKMDGLSDHKTLKDAQRAIIRYQRKED